MLIHALSTKVIAEGIERRQLQVLNGYVAFPKSQRALQINYSEENNGLALYRVKIVTYFGATHDPEQLLTFEAVHQSTLEFLFGEIPIVKAEDERFAENLNSEAPNVQKILARSGGDVNLLIRDTTEEFDRDFATISFFQHRKDVHMVAANATNILSGSSEDTFTGAFLKSLKWTDLSWFDNPLVVLSFFGIRPSESTRPAFPTGADFYRKMDFSPDTSSVLADYLLGWMQIHKLQQHMVRLRATGDSKPPILFNENPDYIANTDKIVTLKTPLHTVFHPKIPPQDLNYANRASWYTTIDTKNLAVYKNASYFLVPPF